MSKRRHKISSEIKSRILAEVLKPESNIPKIAKVYGISDGTIYRFRREAQKLTKNTNTHALRALSSEKSATTTSCAGKFIELSICDSQDAVATSECANTAAPIMSTSASTASTTLNYCSLQKAHLVFNDFSVVLEGKIKTSCMVDIIKVLSEGAEEYSC